MATPTARDLYPNATPDQIARIEAGTLDPFQLIKYGGATAESLKLIFPNATDEQRKRLANGEDIGRDLIKYGGATAESLKLLYPSANPDQINRALKGEDIHDDLVKYGGTKYKTTSGEGTGAPGTTEAPKEEKQAKEGVGVGELKILQGKEMKYYFDPKSGKWYIEYGLPGSDRTMVFEATPEQMDQIFGENRRPADFERITLNRLLQREGVTFGGDIAEMEGEGQFEAEVQRVQALALDNGKLPDWAKDSPEAMDIIYTAQAEGKSDEWVIDQLSKLPQFKERFPNIDKFKDANNLTMTEAIGGFLEYEAGLRQAYKAAGFDPATVTPKLAGDMLEAGHSLEVINRTVGTWKRMKDYKPALDAFNQILVANGLEPLKTMDEYMAFVAGKASAEMYDLWEQSSIQEAAQAAGLGDIFSAADAIHLAKGTNQTLESATAGMQKAAELLLRMRYEVDLGKYGLDQDEILDISLGQTPRSGRSQAEIFENINRAVLSAQKTMQKGVQAFTSYGDKGSPQAASLQNLRPSS